VSVPDAATAAATLVELGAERVFLAVGRVAARHFATCTKLAFVVRAIEPVGDVLGDAEVVLQRGPFGVADERALLTSRRIDTIVAKNSGGDATVAKLVAARQLGIRVLMIARPPQPDVTILPSVEAACRWLETICSVGSAATTTVDPA
jgi:precorrin-6A/cobalt-precorrin-6A reductase